MQFERMKYLEWAKQNMGTVRYDLARADIKHLKPEELPWDPRSIRFSRQWDNAPNELVPLIAERYNVPAANVFLTHGASLGIFTACAALLKPGDEILMEVPNYEPLYQVARACGVEVKILERRFDKKFQIDLEELQRRISKNTRALVITNLHNPSGVATWAEKMQTIAQIARHNGSLVLCGEAYGDYTFGEPITPACKFGEHMISIKTLSKTYGLGGIRMGWLLADEPHIARFRQVYDYLNVVNAVPTEQIALAAFQNLDALRERTAKIVNENLPILREWVDTREDVQWVPPDGGTICFLRLLYGISSWELMRLLKTKYDTLVVPGDFFWAKGFIRVGFGGDTEMLRKGLENLGKALDEIDKEKHPYN
ncbi:MAG: aminotransferase class I/II-fold pyridoxal phosphate-dependent enzyme [Planctomycetes bacterium]|nr:aminotransferase class I/II-fold pyridoxal phosphate-dependent enzyme [Planctomycetota bacterium]